MVTGNASLSFILASNSYHNSKTLDSLLETSSETFLLGVETSGTLLVEPWRAPDLVLRFDLVLSQQLVEEFVMQILLPH
jgi:hypothetical protein